VGPGTGPGTTVPRSLVSGGAAAAVTPTGASGAVGEGRHAGRTAAATAGAVGVTADGEGRAPRRTAATIAAITLGLLILTLFRPVPLEAADAASDAPADAPALSVTSRFSRDEADPNSHRYRLPASRGSVLEVLLRSSEVDTYLEVRLPDGRRVFNDDFDGLDAGVVETVPVDGIVEIVAAPIVSLQEGRYELTVHVREPLGGVPRSGEDTPPPVPEVLETVLLRPGRLEWGDARGYDGKFVDTIVYEATGGESVVIDLTSDDFDALLFVASPEGIIQGDDDDGGEGTNARLRLTFPEDGRYEIRVTSYAEATGAYVLTVFR